MIHDDTSFQLDDKGLIQSNVVEAIPFSLS